MKVQWEKRMVHMFSYFFSNCGKVKMNLDTHKRGHLAYGLRAAVASSELQ